MNKIYFLFNKKTEEFVTWTIDARAINPGLMFKTIELPADVDYANIGWEGNFSTGHFIMHEKPTIVREYELLEKLYDRFFRKYSFEKMTMLFMLQIERMIHDKVLTENNMEPDFHQMTKFFKTLFIKYLEETEEFKKSKYHEYKSKEDLQLSFEKEFKN